MAGKTTIEWTAMPGFAPAVWNPTTGCTRVSAGCDNCYAFALHDKRFATNLKVAKDAGAHRVNAIAQLTNPETIILRARTLGVKLPWPKQYDLPFSHVQLFEGRLDAPLRTKKPTCYFVDSMADLFHEDVPDDFLDSVWGTMLADGARHHRFLILTKRPERMRRYVSLYFRPASNVWLGTSVEDQRSADERIPLLLATPAAVRFLSCEPLLGEVRLTAGRGLYVYGHIGKPCHVDGEGFHWIGEGMSDRERKKSPIDWVIVGGESGPRARPMDLAWARSLRDQCAAAGVSFFMKQLGSHQHARIPLSAADAVAWLQIREPHGRNVDEWPEDLRIRTWPQ